MQKIMQAHRNDSLICTDRGRVRVLLPNPSQKRRTKQAWSDPRHEQVSLFVVRNMLHIIYNYYNIIIKITTLLTILYYIISTVGHFQTNLVKRMFWSAQIKPRVTLLLTGAP
jgi:hypothetical protein